MAIVTVEFEWTPEEAMKQHIRLGEEALAIIAILSCEEAKIDPPYKTGRYQRSIRVATPGYLYYGNDFAEASERDLGPKSIDEVVDQMSYGAIIVGSFLPYSYNVQVNARDEAKRHNIRNAVTKVLAEEGLRDGSELILRKTNV